MSQTLTTACLLDDASRSCSSQFLSAAGGQAVYCDRLAQVSLPSLPAMQAIQPDRHVQVGFSARPITQAV